MLDNHTRLLRSPDYVLEELDGELLLYHPGRTRTVYLNDSASLVWRLCEGRTADEITKFLKETYPESVEDLDADVRETLETLISHGAVTQER